MSVITNLAPKLLWKYFDEIRKIPRCSGDEKAMGDYVISVAEKNRCEYKRDSVGSVVIKVPATSGHENAKTVILQGHLDMVCDKNSDKEFDFSKDPIQLRKDGDWLMADGTTLGADNGIGVAAALATIEDDSLVHGPLELLFTIDEERGLTGAMQLGSDMLDGRILINMDSEELGIFSIGCAGGADSTLTLPVKREIRKEGKLLKVLLSGLRGGHSGIDIHEGRGNAIKILNRLLWQASKDINFSLVSIEGGNKRNAIPREVWAEVVVSNESVSALKSWFESKIESIKNEFKPVETAIEIKVEEKPDSLPKVLDASSKENLMNLVFALPHGPLAMSRAIKELVETSNNVATISTESEKIVIGSSSRSSNGDALEATRNKLKAIADMAGADIDQPEGYPGWMPNLESPLLAVVKDTYKQVMGEDAQVQAIHAGLECGLIGEKYEGMDMISIGPQIENPHSPEERIHIGSVADFWKHVVKTLEVLA